MQMHAHALGGRCAAAFVLHFARSRPNKARGSHTHPSLWPTCTTCTIFGHTCKWAAFFTLPTSSLARQTHWLVPKVSRGRFPARQLSSSPTLAPNSNRSTGQRRQSEPKLALEQSIKSCQRQAQRKRRGKSSQKFPKVFAYLNTKEFRLQIVRLLSFFFFSLLLLLLFSLCKIVSPAAK